VCKLLLLTTSKEELGYPKRIICFMSLLLLLLLLPMLLMLVLCYRYTVCCASLCHAVASMGVEGDHYLYICERSALCRQSKGGAAPTEEQAALARNGRSLCSQHMFKPVYAATFVFL
jgi:hypothetical protein